MAYSNADFTPGLKGYSNVKPFRFWCQKVLPLVYDDSLSYYELLCKVVDYLNNVISDLSATEDNVGDLLTAYNQLQDYVNNYFTNLDVQEEINTKLDAMFEDGTIPTMIEGYVDPFIKTLNENYAELDDQINETMATQNENIATLTARVNNLVVNNTTNLTGYNVVTVESTTAQGGNTVTENIPASAEILQVYYSGYNDSNDIIKSDNISYKSTPNIPTSTQQQVVVTITDSTDTRFNVFITYAISQNIEIAELTDIRVGYDDTVYSSAGNAVRGQVRNLQNDINQYRKNHTVIDNYNIYAESNYNISGYWINASGEFVSNADSKYCKVPVCGGNDLTLWYNSSHAMQSSALGGIVLQDINGNTVEVLEHADYLVSGKIYGSYGYFTFPLPSNCAYVLITTKLATAWDDTDRIIMKYGDGFDGYDGTGNKIITLDGFGFYANSEKPYNGVKWGVFGDSLTEVNSTAKTKYYDWLSEELGFSVVNYGASGTGYMRTYDEGKAFYQRMANIDVNAFDFMTIFGSGNDIAMLINGDIQLGTCNDYSAAGTTPTTIGGAINQTLERYYSIAPTKPIGIVTPTPWAAYCTGWRLNRDNALIMQQYCDLLVEIAHIRGIPCLNLFNESGFRPWDANFRVAYYKENGVQDGGTHPNSAGHKLLSYQFRQFIKKLI